jgi:hypothetical protein
MLKVKQTFYEAMKEVDLEIPILYILLFLHILLCTKDLAAGILVSASSAALHSGEI